MTNIEFFKHRGYWKPRSQVTTKARAHGYRVLLDEPPDADDEDAAEFCDDDPAEERRPS